MNPAIKHYADILNGVPYGKEDTLISPISADLKEQRIVVVFGASDDLMEFRGAINDELGAWNGTMVYLNNKGLLSAPPCGYEESLEECPYNKGLLSAPPCGYEESLEECPYYNAQERTASKIKTVWCGDDGYSWTFETNIPHETFEVIEDGEKYCRGIVFSLDELENPMPGSDMTFKEAAYWWETDAFTIKPVVPSMWNQERITAMYVIIGAALNQAAEQEDICSSDCTTQSGNT